MILCNFFFNVEKILILIKRAFLKNKIFRKLHLHKRSVLLEEKNYAFYKINAQTLLFPLFANIPIIFTERGGGTGALSNLNFHS